MRHLGPILVNAYAAILVWIGISIASVTNDQTYRIFDWWNDHGCE